MGKIKQILMSKTMDDMGKDEHPYWLLGQLEGFTKVTHEDIPDTVYKQAELSRYTSEELLDEVFRRQRAKLDDAFAEFNKVEIGRAHV